MSDIYSSSTVWEVEVSACLHQTSHTALAADLTDHVSKTSPNSFSFNIATPIDAVNNDMVVHTIVKAHLPCTLCWECMLWFCSDMPSGHGTAVHTTAGYTQQTLCICSCHERWCQLTWMPTPVQSRVRQRSSADIQTCRSSRSKEHYAQLLHPDAKTADRQRTSKNCTTAHMSQRASQARQTGCGKVRPSRCSELRLFFCSHFTVSFCRLINSVILFCRSKGAPLASTALGDGCR